MTSFGIGLLLAIGSAVLAPALPPDEGVGDPIARSRAVTAFFDYTAQCYDHCNELDLHISRIEPSCACGSAWSDDETSRLMEKALTYFRRLDCGSSAECAAAWTKMWDEVDLDKAVQ